MKHGSLKSKFSTPLTEPPAFLSTISMISDNQDAIVKKLREAEITTPAFYKIARELFNRTLSGDLTFDQALTQAADILEPTDRKCAFDVLDVSKDFLLNQQKS